MQSKKQIIFFVLLAILSLVLLGLDHLISSHFRSVFNPDSALNVFDRRAISLSLVGFLVYIPIAVKKRVFFSAPSLLLLAGAIANLIERIFWGGIRDYLDFRFFQSNISDVVIFFGLAGLIFLLLKQKHPPQNL